MNHIFAPLLVTFALVSNEGDHLGFWTSEHLVIITNVLVVLASLLLAWATIRDAHKDRVEEQKTQRLLIRTIRSFGARSNPSKHRKGN